MKQLEHEVDVNELANELVVNSSQRLKYSSFVKGLAIGSLIGVGAICGSFIGAVGLRSEYKSNGRLIPNNIQVQEGYIAPGLVRLSTSDIDGNEEPETIQYIGNKPFMLKWYKERPILEELEKVSSKDFQEKSPELYKIPEQPKSEFDLPDETAPYSRMAYINEL